MAGGSYGGGIQLVSAAIDDRIDAIAPTIAWNSLLTSIFPEGNIKLGWGSVLVAAGAQGSLQGGGSDPAAAPGRQDPHFYYTVTNGIATGTALAGRPRLVRLTTARGSSSSRVKVPTLLIQGTVDTLFPLDEAVANFETIRQNTTSSSSKKKKGKKKGRAAKKRKKGKRKAQPVPTKMIWFCGGHGACFTGAGPEDYVIDRTLAWFDRYLSDQKTVDTGPRFAWIADDGEVRTSGRFPLNETGRLQASGTGVLPIAPGQGSGGLIFASASPTAANLTIPGPSADANVLGAPSLSLTYTGNAVPAKTFVYAQIVNPRNGFVLGNIATPIPVTLDGQQRTISRRARDGRRAGAGRRRLHPPARPLLHAVRPPALGGPGHLRLDPGQPPACRARRRAGRREAEEEEKEEAEEEALTC